MIKGKGRSAAFTIGLFHGGSRIRAHYGNRTKTECDPILGQPNHSTVEEDLGAQLSDRVGRSVRLNDFGKTFLYRVDRAFMQLEQGKREIRDRSNLETGFVKLAVNTAGTLPGILRLFRKNTPTPNSILKVNQNMFPGRGLTINTSGINDYPQTS